MKETSTLAIIAPTVEEAIAQGLDEVGLTTEAVRVEVLDAGNKGLFGFGKHQVRVRLTVNTGESEPVQQLEPAPVLKPEAQPDSVKEAESPSETNTLLLNHTEVVISKLLHLL